MGVQTQTKALHFIDKWIADPNREPYHQFARTLLLEQSISSNVLKSTMSTYYPDIKINQRGQVYKDPYENRGTNEATTE